MYNSCSAKCTIKINFLEDFMERENDFGVFAVMYVKQLIEANERPSIDGWKNFIYMQTKNENNRK